MRYVSPFAPQEQGELPEWIDRELPQLLVEGMPTAQAATGMPTGFLENFAAGYEAERAGWLMRSRRAMIEDVRRRREELIEELSGKSYDEVLQPYRARVLQQRARQGRGLRLEDTQLKLWDTVDDEALKLLVQEHQDWREKLPVTPEEVRLAAIQQALDAEAEAEDVARRGDGWSAWLGGFLGGMAANLTDPQNIVSGVFSGGSAQLSTMLAREAAIGAGASTAALPWVSSWREELGKPMTAGEMAAQVAADAVASAGIAAATHGAGRLFQRWRNRRSEELLAEQRKAKTDEEQALLEEVAADAHLRESNPIGDEPEAQAEHVARTAEAERAAAEGRKPDIPDEPVAPPDEMTPVAPKPGSTQALTEGIYKFDPEELLVDAKRFQFKEGGDEYGVTDRLAGVKRWIPERAGQVMVWEAEDGSRYIVDGHQRLGLARRIMEQDDGQRPVLLGTLLRERDGVSAEMARARAAAKNIAEGTGTALDAAKVLRDAPEVAVDLPPNSALVRDAKGLAQLDDDAFMMVVNGKVAANHAAIVGRLAADKPELHASIMGVLAKHKPASAIEAESMVRDALHAGQVKEVQQTLFGEEASTRVLYAERAKLLSWAVRHLQRDRQAFRTLVREAGRIEEAGNKLRKDANARRAEEDAALIETLQKLARRKGEVADALAKAAERLARGEKLADVGGDFLDAVRRAAPVGGKDGRAGRGSRRAAEGKMAGVEKRAEERNLEAPSSKPEEDEAAAIEKELRDLVEAEGDMELPWGEEGNTRKLSELIEEAAADEKAAREIQECLL